MQILYKLNKYLKIMCKNDTKARIIYNSWAEIKDGYSNKAYWRKTA